MQEFLTYGGRVQMRNMLVGSVLTLATSVLGWGLVGGGVYLYFHPAFGQPIILGQPSDLLSRYQSAPLIPGPGRFRSGFTQATVIVYEDDSVVATLAVGKLPSQYGHAVIRSSATRRASCARAQYQIGNLDGVVPAQLVLPVRYRDGIASATFYNRGGYLMGDVPLRESQAAVALPNEMISAAQRHDLVVTIRIFNNQGQEARLNYLPAENQLNAIASTPHNTALGRENDFVQYQSVGGVDFVAIVPKGFCSP